MVNEEWHENIIELSQNDVVDYLITISNIINAVENGNESIEEVSNWLDDQLNPFFHKKDKYFIFTAPIWHLKQNI